MLWPKPTIKICGLSCVPGLLTLLGKETTRRFLSKQSGLTSSDHIYSQRNSVSGLYTLMTHIRFPISISQCSGNHSVQSELIRYSCGYNVWKWMVYISCSISTG